MEEKMNNVINDDPKIYQDALENGVVCYINDKKEEAILTYDQIVNYQIKEISSERFLLIKSEQLKNNISFCRDCLIANSACYLLFSTEMKSALAELAIRKNPSLFRHIPFTDPYNKEAVNSYNEIVNLYKELYLKTNYPIERKDGKHTDRFLLQSFSYNSRSLGQLIFGPIIQILAEVKVGKFSQLTSLQRYYSYFKSLDFAKECIELNPESISVFNKEIVFNIDIIRYLNTLPKNLLSSDLIDDLKCRVQYFDITSAELANELEKLLGMKIEVKNKFNSAQPNKVTTQGYKQYKEQKNSQNNHNNYHNNRQHNGGYHKNNNDNGYNNRPRQNYNRNNDNFKAPWHEMLEKMKNEMEED